MAYPYKLLKVTWGGTMFNNSEIWTNSIHIGRPDMDVSMETFTSDTNATDGIVEALKTFHKTSSMIPTTVKLEWVKFASIGLDGKYAGQESGDYEYVRAYDFEPVSGAQSILSAPQLSVAVTLDTMVRRGLAKTGRFYLPACGIVENTGKLSSPNIFANAAGTLLSSINAAVANNEIGVGTMDQVVVASKEREGAINFVQYVRVGDVIDTQRKRRNQLTEVYTNADVVVKPGSQDDYELAT